MAPYTEAVQLLHLFKVLPSGAADGLSDFLTLGARLSNPTVVALWSATRDAAANLLLLKNIKQLEYRCINAE